MVNLLLFVRGVAVSSKMFCNLIFSYPYLDSRNQRVK